MSINSFEPGEEEKTFRYEKFVYYSEWNPRLENILQRIEEKGDNNRILKMKLIGSGKHSSEKIKLKKLRFFRWSFKNLNKPIRFKDTTIDYKKHSKGIPIPIEVVRDEFDYILGHFEEVSKTIIVDEIIWVDNLDNENWNNLRKMRWMGWMSRDVIKLKGDYRKAIPDLEESGVYRPLVLSNVLRFDQHWQHPLRIKGKNWMSANLIENAVEEFFLNLWVNYGDIEAYRVDPKSREAILSEYPVSARFDGHRVKFE